MVIAEPKPKPKITEWQVQKPSDLIREKGWCQDAYEYQGKYCLVGAINSFCNIQWSSDLMDIVEIMVDKLSHEGYAPESWNDEEDRTEQEVLDLLMDAEQEFENLYPEILKD